jgi:hypothetical protein
MYLLTHSFIHSLRYSVTILLTYPLTDTLIHLPIHSVTHDCLSWYLFSMINNDIGADGAAAVSKMLRINTGLRELK